MLGSAALGQVAGIASAGAARVSLHVGCCAAVWCAALRRFLGIAAVMGVITKDNPHFVAHAQMPTMQRHMANRLAMSWGLI